MTDETPIADTATVEPGGDVSRLKTVMHRSSTIGGTVLFERATDDTNDVYRAVSLTTKHHEWMGEPEVVTVTVEPGDRLQPDDGTEPAPADSDLRSALKSALNIACRENESNTPDFILAEFMLDALTAFERASLARERWYGKSLTIGGETVL